MANSRKGNTITVTLGEDLFTRVNKVAEARRQSTAEFVRELLDAKTRKLQKAIDEIKRQEALIQKEYDGDDESGQDEVRRAPWQADKSRAAKTLRNKTRQEKQP
jgi:Arc/MetJ-type ribon-helix-helix transcriptional regulator